MRFNYGLVIYIDGDLDADTFKEAVKKAIEEAENTQKIFNGTRVEVDYVLSAKEEKDD